MTAQLDAFERDTLREAREKLMEERWTTEGTRCPCCDQQAKVYRRSLYRKPCAELVRLVRWWIDSPGYYELDGRDLCKLEYWQLVELEPGDRERSRRTKSWRPTARGVDFACGRIRLPKSAHVYNNGVIEFVGDSVLITDVLPDDFDYLGIFDTQRTA